MAAANVNQWREFWQRLGAHGDSLPAWRELETVYSESWRAYHNLHHIGHCLEEFAPVRPLADEPIAERHVFRPTPEDRAVIYMAQAAEVRVDRETGQVTPTRVVSVHEVGRVINPLLFKTQIEGGLLQGLGYALMEEVAIRDGRVANLNLHEYKIPTMADLPDVEAVLLEPDPRLGITPIGEGPNAGLAPAIVSAVMDVVGPQIFDLPLSPEAVRRAAMGASPYQPGRVR